MTIRWNACFRPREWLINYTEINVFIKSLNKYQDRLSKQQLKTLRGQALSGNLAGAKKSLTKLLKV